MISIWYTNINSLQIQLNYFNKNNTHNDASTTVNGPSSLFFIFIFLFYLVPSHTNTRQKEQGRYKAMSYSLKHVKQTTTKT